MPPRITSSNDDIYQLLNLIFLFLLDYTNRIHSMNLYFLISSLDILCGVSLLANIFLETQTMNIPLVITAKGARGIPLEPLIYAIRMKVMVAVWHNPNSLSSLVLSQTYNASVVVWPRQFKNTIDLNLRVRLYGC